MTKFRNYKFFKPSLFGLFFVLVAVSGFFVKQASAASSVISGSISLDGVVRYGETLTVNTSSVIYTPPTSLDVPIYSWHYGSKGTTISGATSKTYVIDSSLIGETIFAKFFGDGSHATGALTSPTTLAVAKAYGPATPAAPALVSKTSGSVTLEAVSANEFSKDNGVTWQDSNVFTGLESGTAYTFITRVKETSTTESSENSAGTTVTTTAFTGSVMTGSISITGNTAFGETLSVNTSTLIYTPATDLNVLSYVWKRNGVTMGDVTSTYALDADDIGTVITVIVTADGTNAVGSVTSAGTTAIEKAEAPTPSASVLSSRSTTSINVSGGKFNEHSIDGGVTWFPTGSFSGLTPNTSYSFVNRTPESTTVKASGMSEAVTFSTTASDLGGTVSIVGSAKYGETLTADISGLTYTPLVSDDVPTYQWVRGGTNIAGATSSSYVLTVYDIGNQIMVSVTADGTHAVGVVSSAKTTSVSLADAPAAPSAPTLLENSPTVITLVANSLHEFSRDAGLTWQSSNIFRGLATSTAYTFIARIKETVTTKRSGNSDGAIISTEAFAGSVMAGVVSIDGDKSFGETLTANLSMITYAPSTTLNVPTYQWLRDGVNITGATSSTYETTVDDVGLSLSLLVTADDVNATGEVLSTGYKIAKVVNSNIPDAPVLASKTYKVVTLVANSDYEFSRDNGDTWQSSNIFTGLTNKVAYSFVVRFKETATTKASVKGAALAVTTEDLPTLGGTPVVNGETKLGQTLSVDVSGVTYTQGELENVPVYRWYRDTSGNGDYVQISGADSATYQPVLADLGLLLGVAVFGDGVHAKGDSYVAALLATAIAKADPAAPTAPTLSSKTTDTVILVANSLNEFSKDGGATWQDSNIFTGLTANTSYSFVTRSKETATANASNKSSVATIATVGNSSSGGGGAITAYCSSVVYGDWSKACVGNFRFRSIISQSPLNCSLSTAQQLATQMACEVSVPVTEKEDKPIITTGKTLLQNLAIEASVISDNNRDTFLAQFGGTSDSSKEQSSLIKYQRILELDKGISAEEKMTVNNFITYGTETTRRLGSGERAAVINSYFQAYAKLPNSEAEWSDVVKIASGRWPSERSAKTEAQAKLEFRKVYQRSANLSDNLDENAIMVISYGLLPLQRNLNSERVAIKTFRSVYRHDPINALAWNIVRAIAYSGTTR